MFFYNTPLRAQSRLPSRPSCFWHTEEGRGRRGGIKPYQHTRLTKSLLCSDRRNVPLHRLSRRQPGDDLITAHHILKRRKYRVLKDLEHQRKEPYCKSMARSRSQRFKLVPELTLLTISRIELCRKVPWEAEDLPRESRYQGWVFLEKMLYADLFFMEATSCHLTVKGTETLPWQPPPPHAEGRHWMRSKFKWAQPKR